MHPAGGRGGISEKIFILACFLDYFLNASHSNTATFFARAVKPLCLILFMAFLASAPAMAQNAKGDRPSSGRESRFKSKGSSKRPKKVKNRRVTPKSRSGSASASTYTQPRRSARGRERAGKPIRPTFRSNSAPSSKQKAWRGDITGRRLRSRNSTSSAGKANVYKQSGRYVTKTPGRGASRTSGGRVTRARRIPSNTGKVRNVYPTGGNRVGGVTRPGSEGGRTVSNRGTLSRLKRIQTSPGAGSSGGGRGKVVPRSASSPFIRRKSINVYARFKRPKHKGEQATTRDIAGHPLRGRNYETPRPSVSTQTVKPYPRRRRVGDRPYSGSKPTRGTYRSATKPGERAWTGDVAGRRIRHRDRSSKRRIEGMPSLAKHVRSRTRPGEKRPGLRPVAVQAPGIGAKGINRGRMRGQRPLKGGGSASGRLWNNGNTPIGVRTPKGGAGINYSGRMKGGRPLKGGGSVSGRLWNNGNTPIGVRTPKGSASINYSGRMKGGKPLKGGGSVSGRLWNNDQQAVAVRRPRLGLGAGTFQGRTKTRRPLKGGGSVSGKLWNNDQSPILGRRPRSGPGLGVGTFQGRTKAGKPLKGGGSVSGKLWNNDQSPILGRRPRSGPGLGVGTFQGHTRAHRPLKGGGSVSGKLWNNDESPILGRRPRSGPGLGVGTFQGHTRARRPLKGGGSVSGKLWNNDETPLDGKPPARGPGLDAATYHSGVKLPHKRKNYVQNDKASEESILKRRPVKGTFEVDKLQTPVKRRSYVKNPNTAEGGQLKLKPTNQTNHTNDITARVKQYHYVRNPSSSEEALRVREPGKAFARATDYQGNIRMRKFSLFDKNRNMHPDSRFVKINKNNVDSERDAITNLKLWWARLFKKQETQPEHLKDKGRKPRYDKGEQGMWND